MKNINQIEVGRQWFHFEVWQSTWCQVLSSGPKSSPQKWQSINNSVIDRFEIREVVWGYHVKQPVSSLITTLQDFGMLSTHELQWRCVYTILVRSLAVSDTDPDYTYKSEFIGRTKNLFDFKDSIA